MKSLLVCIFLGFIFLNGCIPYKREVVLAPKIEGQVTMNGKPISDLLVSYGENKDDACLHPSESMKTGAAGKFFFNGKTETRETLVLMPVHEYRSWGLCFRKESPDSTVEARWQGHSYGPESAPDVLQLACELSPLRSQSEEPVPGLRTPIRGEWGCKYLNLAAHEIENN